MSDVLPENCGWGATREPARCRGAKSKSDFPTVQASFSAQHPSDTLKLPGTTVCLPSDHVVQIHDGQCLSNPKAQPKTPWSLTDSSVIFLVEEILSSSTAYVWLSNWNVYVKFLPSLQQNFTHTHTRCSSSSFIVTLSLIRRTARARAQVSGCSSTTNAHSETGQMAVCCQNLTLGALSSRSALTMLVGALFKKFGLFLNTTRSPMLYFYVCSNLYVT